MKFYTNMLSSMKLKVQEAAKKLRREETKIFKTLNKVEESGAQVDFFDEGKKINFFDEEMGDDGLVNTQLVNQDQ